MTRHELKAISLTFKTIHVNGRTHVIRPFEREDSKYPLPNYRNTFMALAGVLGREPETGMLYAETLEQFRERWVDDQLRIRQVE